MLLTLSLEAHPFRLTRDRTLPPNRGAKSKTPSVWKSCIYTIDKINQLFTIMYWFCAISFYLLHTYAHTHWCFPLNFCTPSTTALLFLPADGHLSLLCPLHALFPTHLRRYPCFPSVFYPLSFSISPRRLFFLHSPPSVAILPALCLPSVILMMDFLHLSLSLPTFTFTSIVTIFCPLIFLHSTLLLFLISLSSWRYFSFESTSSHLFILLAGISLFTSLLLADASLPL